jgi:hypothetical protein
MDPLGSVHSWAGASWLVLVSSIYRSVVDYYNLSHARSFMRFVTHTPPALLPVNDAARNQNKASDGSVTHMRDGDAHGISAGSVSAAAVAYAASLLRPSTDQRYLSSLPLHRFEMDYLYTDPPVLPTHITATEFKRKYGGHGDPATVAMLKQALEEEAAEVRTIVALIASTIMHACFLGSMFT